MPNKRHRPQGGSPAAHKKGGNHGQQAQGVKRQKLPSGEPSKKQQPAQSSAKPAAAAPVAKKPSAAAQKPAAAAPVKTRLSLGELKTPTEALQFLLGSMPAEKFFDEFWEQKPLHIRRKAPEYYGSLFSKAQFDKSLKDHQSTFQYGYNLNLCVCEDGVKIDKNPELPTDEEEKEEEEEKKAVAPAKSVEKNKTTSSKGKASKEEAADQAASASGDSEDDEESSDEDGEAFNIGQGAMPSKSYAPVDFETVEALFKEGCTIQSLHPQQLSNDMWRLNALLEEYFGALVGANVYITPTDSQGLAPHHDDVDVFVLQLEGTKHWKLYEPVEELASQPSGDFDSEEIGKPTMELDLAPGDLLYFPRGVIHEARSIGDTHSTHVTISTYQRLSWSDFLSASLPQALAAATEEHVEFRRGLPVNFVSFLGSAHRPDLKDPPPVGAETIDNGPINPFLSPEKKAQQAQFAVYLKALLKRLTDYVDVHDAADSISEDFMRNRLPPAVLPCAPFVVLPPVPALPVEALMASVGDDEDEEEEEEEADGEDAEMKEPPPEFLAAQELRENAIEEIKGPMPVEGSTKIRLTHPSALRMVISTEEDDGEPQVVVTHSLRNSQAHHMDGRFPPTTSETLKLPVGFAPAIMYLLSKFPSFVRVDQLPVTVDDAEGDEEEEEDEKEEDEEMAPKPTSEESAERLKMSQISAAAGLWSIGMLQVQAGAASASASAGASGSAASASASADNGASKKQVAKPAAKPKKGKQ